MFATCTSGKPIELSALRILCWWGEREDLPPRTCRMRLFDRHRALMTDDGSTEVITATRTATQFEEDMRVARGLVSSSAVL